MSKTTISPNMNLPVPVVGVDPGPEYAIDLNNCLNTIDQHDHSPDHGVQITPDGLNINIDLPFNGHSATVIKKVALDPQSSALPTGSNPGAVYVVNNELYYNDVTGGHQIPITANGSVNSGSGSIGGLPSGTASANYNSGTFVFRSATATPANLDGESLILRNNAANSKGLTISPPASMGTDINLTLPTPPGANGFLQIDTSGNITNTALADNVTISASAGIISVKNNVMIYEFKLNGNYGNLTMPSTALDGLCFFNFNAQIVNVWAWIKSPGSSGSTAIDLKLATAPGGSFSTIFTVKPQFASTATTDAYVDANGVVSPGTGVTAPSLLVTSINAGSVLRFDLTSAMVNPDSCGITVMFQQR